MFQFKNKLKDDWESQWEECLENIKLWERLTDSLHKFGNLNKCYRYIAYVLEMKAEHLEMNEMPPTDGTIIYNKIEARGSHSTYSLLKVAHYYTEKADTYNFKAFEMEAVGVTEIIPGTERAIAR